MFQTRKNKNGLLAIINSFFLSFCCYTQQKYAIYQQNSEKNRMFSTQKYKNFGSLAPLARNN